MPRRKGPAEKEKTWVPGPLGYTSTMKKQG